jgi:HTH-type transcriptional regulator/antitoxin HigA
MDIHPIKTDADYQAALKRIEALFAAAPNSPQADELEVLTMLLEAYEEQHFAIPVPDPVEAVKYFMESRGLSRKDLEPYIGNRARVSEILNRKRPLTLRMIQRLHNELGIPAEALVQSYQIPRVKSRKESLANTRVPVARTSRSASQRVRATG